MPVTLPQYSPVTSGAESMAADQHASERNLIDLPNQSIKLCDTSVASVLVVYENTSTHPIDRSSVQSSYQTRPLLDQRL